MNRILLCLLNDLTQLFSYTCGCTLASQNPFQCQTANPDKRIGQVFGRDDLRSYQGE